MQSPSGKPLPRRAANDIPPGQPRPHATYWLLAMVAAMALATAATLWWTLRQTHVLAQPHQQNDLWYVSSVHNELARVSLLARKVRAREASTQDLQERLEVLLGTLDTSGRGPRVSTQLREALPEAAQDLDSLRPLVERWSTQLAPLATQNGNGNGKAAAITADIVRQSDTLLDRLRKVVATVHLFSAQEASQARQQLSQRFLLLSAVLGGLLLGTALLIAKLVRDTRLVRAASQQLVQANRQLEVRVASRTRKIEEGRALLSFILDTSPSDVVLAEVESGRVHFINRRLTERLGLKAAPETLFLPELLHDPETRERFTQALDRYGQVDAMEALIGEHDPCWSSLSARLIEVEGQLAHLLWGFDISAHKALEVQLRELATRDALSGLLNRRAFLERSTALFDHCRRHGQPCAVLMIDIDHFKRINDRHGHQMGDVAIRTCAEAIGHALRDADLLGRLGGEEFAVLLPHATADSAMVVAERIRSGMAQMNIVSPQGQPLSFTISIGVAEMAAHHAGIEPLLVDADQALYRAKATGRNKVLAYEVAIGQS